MQTKQAIEQIEDEVWARALGKIIKGKVLLPLRAGLGDEIDMIVPQVAMAGLMSTNPGFAKVLYAAAYASAKRNAYIVTRQVGMPPDFFWKFEYWTQQRAFETMQKVIARVFATIMSNQKQGTLELVSTDVERVQFEMAFADCAECSGLATGSPICYFHAGLLAGILGGLLNRDLDAVELECVAKGGKVCRFKVGKPDDREIKIALDERQEHFSIHIDYSKRVEESLKQEVIRGIGNLVDVGYYQLLLASVFLANLDVLARALMATGEEMGQASAAVILQRFQGDVPSAVTAFYQQLRYTDIRINEQGQEVEVQAQEAPEAIGSMAQAALVPFLCGGLQGLLSSLMHRPLRFQSAQRDGTTLRLRFTP
ncbi:MAG: 4-vinyl reductase [Dehalococcoidia bacterium]|nr:4-vinyl reductase [Dehalococcoidia bacterium]